MAMPLGMNPEWLSGKAQQVWAMLDDMAANDPGAYQKFIQKQLQEGREYFAPPKAVMCVQTQIQGPRGERLFINFCEWVRVPVPATPEDAVPVMGGELLQISDENGNCSVANVAFNPKILEDYGKNASNPTSCETLINLAMDFIEDQHRLRLSRIYTILECDQKGDTDIIHQSFKHKVKDSDAQFEQELGDLEKTFGPVSTGVKDSLLNQLSNIAKDENKAATNPEPVNIKIQNPNNSKVGLIEEISSKTTLREGLKKPEYKMETVTENGTDHLRLLIYLPDVTSVADCELDVSEDDVHLVVPEEYELHLDLTKKINDGVTKAIFNKKTTCLTLTMPIVS